MAVAGGKLMGTTQDQVVMVEEVACELDLIGRVGTGWRERERKALVGPVYRAWSILHSSA